MKRFGFILGILLLISCNYLIAKIWEPCNNGMDFDVIVTVASNTSSIYVATQNNGVYKSNDWGLNWINLNNTFSGYKYKINKIILYKNGVYICTNYGIFFTIDDGKNWESIGYLTYGIIVNSMCFNGDNIYAGTEFGINFSTDKGKTWSQMPFNKDFENTLDIFANGNLIIARTESGFYISSDSGKKWQSKMSPLSYNNFHTISCSLSPNYILIGSNPQNFYKSSDTCKTWQKINIETNNTENINSIIHYNNKIILGTGDYQTNSDIIIVMENDGKLNSIYNVGTRNKVNSISINDSSIVAGTNIGVYVSLDNGKNWILRSTEIIGEIDSFLTFDSLLVVSTPNGIFISNDNGKNWRINNKGLIKDSRNLSFLFKNYNSIYATYNGKLLISSDFTESWQVLTEKFPYSIQNMYFYKNEIIGLTTDGIIFKSTDNGENFQKMDTSFEKVIFGSFGQKENFLIGISGDSIYTSTDFGNNWKSQIKTIQDNYYYGITIIDSLNNIYLGNHEALYKSTDFGKNWKLLGDSLLLNRIGGIFIINQTLFVFSSYQLYYSIDYGNSWNIHDNELYSCTSNQLLINNNYVFARCVNLYNIYRAKIADFGLNLKILEFFSENFMLKIKPNPVTDNLFIDISELNLSNSTISIFDILGNELDKVELNNNKLNYDCSRLQSGAYLIVINSQEKIISRKFIVVR